MVLSLTGFQAFLGTWSKSIMERAFKQHLVHTNYYFAEFVAGNIVSIAYFYIAEKACPSEVYKMSLHGRFSALLSLSHETSRQGIDYQIRHAYSALCLLWGVAPDPALLKVQIGQEADARSTWERRAGVYIGLLFDLHDILAITEGNPHKNPNIETIRTTSLSNGQKVLSYGRSLVLGIPVSLFSRRQLPSTLG